MADEAGLLSDEHFTVDGTLIDAWASLKSFRVKEEDVLSGGGKNTPVNFHGEKRRNDTLESTTDPDARCRVESVCPWLLTRAMTQPSLLERCEH